MFELRTYVVYVSRSIYVYTIEYQIINIVSVYVCINTQRESVNLCECLSFRVLECVLFSIVCGFVLSTSEVKNRRWIRIIAKVSSNRCSMIALRSL